LEIEKVFERAPRGVLQITAGGNAAFNLVARIRLLIARFAEWDKAPSQQHHSSAMSGADRVD
jgi:hypothetical protein